MNNEPDPEVLANYKRVIELLEEVGTPTSERRYIYWGGQMYCISGGKATVMEGDSE